MAQQDDRQDGRSIEVKTLVIAAAAAVTAAVVTSLFWQKGTLISTALTPVIVALTQEILRRPAEKVQATASKVTAAPVRGVGALAGVGGRRTPEAERFDERRLLDREHGDGGSNGASANGGNGAAPPPPFDDTRAYDPSRSAGATGSDVPGDTAPAAAAGQPPERRVYGRRRFNWKIALLTGLAAFAIAAVVLTVSELAIGGSVGGDGRTSLFSGGDSASDQAGSDSDSSSDEESNPDEAAPSDSSESEAAPEEESAAPEEEEPAPVEEEPVEPEPVEPQSVPAPE